ncbi:filamentous hemagglutinin N-terminal domain-containing protein [Aerosakkonemataceae cyanobacterium BLCC-F50]|uniref:Filamentous hemagglutinin N-terminal domain-containing protein n=1 Tax=Floridaenema flaviceps BLCC-F50 TaxID=3153642 RepID=A0ABV4Y0S2_9CYAN
MNQLAQSATLKEPRLKALIFTGSLISVLLFVQPIAAQVVPDATLPVGERSQVSGNANVQIDGGARRGGNLFHSFSQFSIPTGGSAYFNNATDVQNIFSRVTGGSISNIDGLIRANGTANLFLLNPNGILFGPNASLNIGGSFLATTANAIGFPNGEVFSSDATQPLPSQLLAINPNALFFNQLGAQPIINRSTANNGTGLQVPAGQNLLLVGGDVRLEGGQIVSPSSHVELGAVAGQGNVGLNGTAGNWRLSFPDGVARSNISLSDGAQINVLADNGGSVAATARNITFTDGSRIRAGIDTGLGFVGAQAGDVELSAVDFIRLDGSSRIDNRVSSEAIGNAGNITLTTSSLSLLNGSQVVAYTFGQGNAGRVTITASDTVSLDGTDDLRPTAVRSLVFVDGVGNSGGVFIDTGSLFVTNEAELNASVTRQAKGTGGGITVNARDRVVFDGGFAFSRLEEGGIGKAGDIRINTGSLLLTGISPDVADANIGQVVSATFGQGDSGNIIINARDEVRVDGRGSTFWTLVAKDQGIGNAGNLTINTGSLSILNGGQLTAIAEGQGNAGNVSINARDTVIIDGVDSIGQRASTITTRVENGAIGNAGNITLTTGSLFLTNGGSLASSSVGAGNAGNISVFARNTVLMSGTAPNGELVRSGVFSSTEGNSVGQAGNIQITAGQMSIQNGAQVAVLSQVEGNAGNIAINAQTLHILSGSKITAESTSTTGGNIDLNVLGILLLRRASQITTSAQGAGTGGNIQINGGFLIAVPNEDSNITANSEDFRGGNIRIDAFSIFGIQPSPVSTPLSDITATGATSALSGTINVITTGIDPTSGLVQLPTDLVESGLIAQGCPADKGNSFVITGRGGLPPTPEQQLDDDAEWSDRRRLVVSEGGRQGDAGTRRQGEVQNSKVLYTPIVEANAIQITPTGEVFLVANSSHSAVQNSLYQPVICPGRR